MRVRFKYTNALLALALLAGQVQYAYTTYFCTEQHAAVSKPTVMMQSADLSSGSNICDECRGVIPVQHGATLAVPNCIQIATQSKDVVSNFTKIETSSTRFETNNVFCVVCPVICSQKSTASYQLLSFADSPPLPLHITNLNFRI